MSKIDPEVIRKLQGCPGSQGSEGWKGTTPEEAKRMMQLQKNHCHLEKTDVETNRGAFVPLLILCVLVLAGTIWHWNTWKGRHPQGTLTEYIFYQGITK